MTTVEWSVINGAEHGPGYLSPYTISTNNMKYIATIVVVACIGGIGAYLYSPKAIEYVSPSIVEKEVVKEVATLEKRIADAQTASSSAIETEARKAYEARKQEMLTEIELRVTREYKNEIEAREVELEKEVGEYWRDPARLRALIREYFPENYQTAIAVAMAESGLNPRALNAQDSHKGCKGSYGIFQIGCLHEKDPSVLYDVEYNVKRAREIYDEHGWQPWGAYTNGSFKIYLAQR